MGSLDPAGYRFLRDVGSDYRDGGEEAVLAIITAASDRTAGSDELIRSATTWPQRYHLDPARTNVVRALDLPADARVLEIGAGCGAITRYLGEQCAVVDALEPVPARAAAAAARCSDLPGVQVVVGELDDVPAEPSYDVVVVVGVLEYVGAGTPALDPYLDFLAGIHARLAEGGTLVLAIENKLGVKYLAGSPEDHTNRVFDSIEGYPRGGKARTFSRRELEGLLRITGLDPQTLVAFPDYKMTRVVFGRFPDSARSLLHRIPIFPSSDWRTARPKMADERSTWAQLVAAGLEHDFGNSLVVLATKGGREQQLWPETRAGIFFSTERRKHLEVRTEVQTADDTVRFVRSAREGAAAVEPDGIRIAGSVTEFEPGVDLPHLVAEQGTAAFAEYADRWLKLLDEALDRDPSSSIDLVPHNLVLGEDGDLHVIDTEFVNFPVTRDQVVRRGVFRLATSCAPLAVPEKWTPAKTVGDLMIELGKFAGLPADGSWIAQTIADEVDFLAAVRPGPATGRTQEQWRGQLNARMKRHVARTLDSGPLGTRVWDQKQPVDAQVSKLRDDIRRLEGELAAVKAHYAKSEKTRKRLEAAAARPALRKVVEAVLPPGSRRGRVARKSLGKAPGKS